MGKYEEKKLKKRENIGYNNYEEMEFPFQINVRK